jgi:hypothetical protein
MYRKGFCERGDFCNMMHSRPLCPALFMQLKAAGKAQPPPAAAIHKRKRSVTPDRNSRSRSRSPKPAAADADKDDDVPLHRSASAERRAKIAAWRAQKK